VARAECTYVCLGVKAGAQFVVPGATVNVYEQGTTTPIAQSLWSSITGGTAQANPLTSGPVGSVQFWLDTAQYVTISWTAPGWAGVVETVPVGAPGASSGGGSGSPGAHAATHAAGGADPVGLTEAQITALSTDLAGKSNTGHSHAAGDVTSGVLAIARLATGTPTGTKFVRDDGVLAVPAAGTVPWQFSQGIEAPAVGNASVTLYVTVATTLTAMRVLRTGGTGATIDILRNGASILTTPASATSTTAYVAGTLTTSPTALSIGDLLKFSIVSIAGGVTFLDMEVEGTRP
jgi:hypothetical protein